MSDGTEYESAVDQDGEDSTGPFITQADVPEVTDIGGTVSVSPTSRQWREPLRAVFETGVPYFVHADGDSFVVTAVSPARSMVTQAELPAESESEFWARITEGAFETLIDKVADLHGPLVFDGDELELSFISGAGEIEAGLWSSNYDNWPVCEVSVTDREGYPSAKIPGWRLAGGLSTVTRQAEANREFKVDIFTEGEEFKAIPHSEDAREPFVLSSVGRDLAQMRATYSRDRLRVIAETVSNGDQLVRLDSQKPILVEDDRVKYAIAPREVAEGGEADA